MITQSREEQLIFLLNILNFDCHCWNLPIYLWTRSVEC